MVKQVELKTAEKLLKKYKIPFPKSYLAKNKKQAIKFAKRLKYPIVMKVSSETILHKTDVGGVITNIQNQDQLEKAYDSIIKKTKRKKIKGILIQEMLQGIHVFVGMKRDPAFGPTIAFGLGGIFIEIMKDVSFKVAPITKSEALEMIKSIKGYPILKGARRKEKANINKLVNILLQASKLAMKEKKIREFDLNPIIVNSKQAKAVDARFLL